MKKFKLNPWETKTQPFFFEKNSPPKEKKQKKNKPCEKKLAKKIAKNKTEPFAKQPQPHAKKKEHKTCKKKTF